MFAMSAFSSLIRSFPSLRFRVNKRKKMHAGGPILAAAPVPSSQAASRHPDANLKMVKIAREKFTQEISFRSKDKDVSLAKALLLVAAEDEAFMAFNQDMDAHSILSERKDGSIQLEPQSEHNNIEEISLAGKTVFGWLNELEIIAKEVEAELVSRDIGCHLVEVLEAVNVVLFESRGFKRYPVLVDSKFSYLHTVLISGRGSAIMLSIIYIEICRRLGVRIVGSRVGEDFLIWPQTENLEELFKASSGHSWLAKVNGRCVEDPRSKASDLNSNSLSGLDIATNKDIIGIALANLIASLETCIEVEPWIDVNISIEANTFRGFKSSFTSTPRTEVGYYGIREAVDSTASQLESEERPWHAFVLQQEVCRSSAGT